MAKLSEVYSKRIKEILNNSKSPMSYKSLYQKCKGRKASSFDYKIAIDNLKKNGIIVEDKAGIYLASSKKFFRAVVSRINKTFGFITRESDGVQLFVPGKFFKGAMPNDVVLARLIEGRGGSFDAEIVKVIEENFCEFSGNIVLNGKRFAFLPDSVLREPLSILSTEVELVEGEKVLAVIEKRGERHFDHKIKIISKFGFSNVASSAVKALIHTEGIETEFSQDVINEAKRIEEIGILDDEIANRIDLRGEVIFTIDGADTKDIDDAISLTKTENCYKLGVHIADVSHYVKSGSALDETALNRGTSIYYANKVIPMLPKELSNGICSLNPKVDRLAFSCFMEIDFDGKLLSYKFEKTVICSKVQGVYSEINSILSGNLTEELEKKYSGLHDTIFLMKELADILTANKIKRGAPQIETIESKIVLDKNDVCVDILERSRGVSELIIEEFMLMANSSAAKFAKEKSLPFLYRVHENPSAERINDLVSTLLLLGINPPKFSEAKPAHLSQVIEQTKGTSFGKIINNMVLRSMAKAKYSDEPLGHFGLVLEDYAHFTSPIRRYPDLAIHRILTDYCYNKKPIEKIQKRWSKFAAEASIRSSVAEVTAMKIERSCNDCFIAEFMKAKIGESFVGEIVSVQEFGFFVQLENTAEGLVRSNSFANGPYDYDGHFSYSKAGKTVYRVGDKVKVTCVSVLVDSGQVDFIVYDDNDEDLV